MGTGRHARAWAINVLLGLSMIFAVVYVPVAHAEEAPLDGEWIPLVGEAPQWYTAEIHQRAIAAGKQGHVYDAETSQATMATSAGMPALFIRPGALMVGPDPAGGAVPITCTMGFVFGSPGIYTISTAGHCTRPGWDVVVLAAPSLIASIGKATVVHDGGIGDDYAFITISEEWQPWVDPNVAGTLGPDGPMYDGAISTSNPVPVKYIGHGWGIGTGGTVRAGVARVVNNERTAYWCTCPIFLGDSGGPALAVTTAHPLGQGLGLLTHMQFGSPAGSTAAGTHLRAFAGTPTPGDLNPAPESCPPPPAQPPNGVALAVCGDTGYAQLTATSTVRGCSGDPLSWSCHVFHRSDLTVSDLAGCATGDGLQACSNLFIPGGASSGRIVTYGAIPPGGRTIIISHTLCLAETIRTVCTFADEVLHLPGPPSPRPDRPLPTIVRLFVEGAILVE